MVHLFGVVNVDANKEVNELAFVWQMEVEFLFVLFSTGLQYRSYGASHFAHTKDCKQDCF
jgi:hypothetical protein